MSADISAGAGNDTLDVDGSTNDIDNGMLADITFDGQGGTDKLDLDDSGDSADAESYELTGISFTKSVGVRNAQLLCHRAGRSARQRRQQHDHCPVRQHRGVPSR
jgi:hypothetical protein